MLVVGGGTMGAAIAAGCALAGHRAVICDRSPALAEQAVAHARARAERVARRGGRTPAPIAATELAAGAADCALAVEAVFERFEAKAEVLRALAAALGPDALVATNTSSLSVGELARASGLERRLVGLHFFQPAERSPLVEVVRTASVGEAQVEAALAFVASLGRTAVVVADAPGFLVNRLARPLYLEAERLLDEGFDAAAVDAVLRGVGLPLGPLEIVDRVGLEVHDAVTRSVYDDLAASRLRPAPVVRRLLRAGRAGAKAGHGFHAYRDGRRVDPAPAAGPTPTVADCGGDAELARRLGAIRGADAVDAAVRLAAPQAATAPRAQPQRDVVVLRSPMRVLDPGLAGHVLAHRPFGADALEVSVSSAAPLETARRLERAALAAGMQPAIVPRRSGLVAHRVLACFVNEAFLVLGERYAAEHEIELAVMLGLGHAHGPLGWVERFGGARAVLATLEGLRETAGEGHDAAPLLHERALLEAARAA